MKKLSKPAGRTALGFTLVELLVVIAIIVLLTGIILTNLNPAKAKARDSKRISDISQIQLALELFFDRCKFYPNVLDIGASDGGVGQFCPSGITFGTYVSQIPTPPTSGETYDYAINNDGTDYVLHTHLEYPSSVTKDSISPFPSGNWSQTFTCSNSDTSLDYCIGPR